MFRPRSASDSGFRFSTRRAAGHVCEARTRSSSPDEADSRRETRKVVIFRDGHEVGDINAQDEFEAMEIDQTEFEKAWADESSAQG